MSSGWYWQHKFKRRTDIDVMRMEAKFGKHIGYAYICKLFEVMGELGGGIPENQIGTAAMFIDIEISDLEWILDDMINADEMELSDGIYVHHDFINDYTGMISRSTRGKKGAAARHDKNKSNKKPEPAGDGKSPKKKAAPPAESSEPESEPDIDPTPEIERFRRNTQEYIRSLDCAALKQDISNRHIQLLFNNYNPVMAEAKACLFYSWKSGKLSSGEKVKNQDFYTINKKSWIDNELKTPVGKELIAEIESKHNWRHAFPRPKDWLKWTESDKRQYITEHTPKPPKPIPQDKPAPPEMLAELQAKKQALREELEGKPGGGK